MRVSWSGRFRGAWVALLAVCFLPVRAWPALGAERTSATGAALAKRVDALIAQLGDARYLVRTGAHKQLREIGWRAFKKLHEATRSGDPEIARRAQQILGPYKRIEALLRKLPQDWHSTLYYNGLTNTQKALVAIGPRLLPYLEQRLEQEQRYLYRFNGITILDAIRTPASLALLRKLSGDPHPWCRVEAVWSLGNAADTQSLPLLLKRLKEDRDATVRKEALIALGKIAGIRLFGITKTRHFYFSSDQYLTGEARRELERVVNYFVKHKRLPEVQTFQVLHATATWRDGSRVPYPDLQRSRNLKGTWKVKTLKPEEGKGVFIFVRLPRDPQSPAAGQSSPDTARRP